MFRFLQTVLFKTDSFFDALFCSFDETIDFIGGISHGEVIIQ